MSKRLVENAHVLVVLRLHHVFDGLEALNQVEQLEHKELEVSLARKNAASLQSFFKPAGRRLRLGLTILHVEIEPPGGPACQLAGQNAPNSLGKSGCVLHPSGHET